MGRLPHSVPFAMSVRGDGYVLLRPVTYDVELKKVNRY